MVAALVNAYGCPVARMRQLLVLQETGLRIGELCGLCCDCLHGDEERGWMMTYYQPYNKMKKDLTIIRAVSRAWACATVEAEARMTI